MERITEAQIRYKMDELADVWGVPAIGREAGALVLQHDACGYTVGQIDTEGGGIRNPLGSWRLTKRELYYMLYAAVESARIMAEKTR